MNESGLVEKVLELIKIRHEMERGGFESIHADITLARQSVALIKAHFKDEAVDAVENAYADKNMQPYKKQIIKTIRGS